MKVIKHESDGTANGPPCRGHPDDVRKETLPPGESLSGLRVVPGGVEAMSGSTGRERPPAGPRPPRSEPTAVLARRTARTYRDRPELRLIPVNALTNPDADEGVDRCDDCRTNASVTNPTGFNGDVSLARALGEARLSHATLPPT